MTPQQAEKLVEKGDWQGAGAAYLELASQAQQAGRGSQVAEYARLGADALRRDDRPAAAAKLLLLGRPYGMDGPMDRLQLSAVLLESGQAEAAVDLARDALKAALLTGEPAVEAVTRDSLAGALLVVGDLEGARQELRAIAGLGLPGAEISRQFREAQLFRLNGLLQASFSRYAALARQLVPYKEALGPLAACYQEQGEILVLCASFALPMRLPDRLTEAEGLFQQAAEAWRKAGRRSGLYRAEAWGLRVRALRGMAVVGSSLDRSVAYAQERGLVFLEADLRVCASVLRKNPTEALRAVSLLAEAPLARGRARVMASELGADWAEDAASELRQDAVWIARYLIGRGGSLAVEGWARAEVLLESFV